MYDSYVWLIYAWVAWLSHLSFLTWEPWTRLIDELCNSFFIHFKDFCLIVDVSLPNQTSESLRDRKDGCPLHRAVHDQTAAAVTHNELANSNKCSICNSVFKHDVDMPVRKGTYHGKQQDLCMTCRRHLMKTSTGKRAYSCPSCSRCFANMGSLVAHLKTFHAEKRPYDCPTCGKRCNTKGLLVNHTRIHPGAGPYKCIVCRESFLWNRNLSAHLATHTGVRPYKCSECGRSYITKAGLNIHLRVHASDRPYKCTCRKSYSSFSLLGTLKQDGEMPYKCITCNETYLTGGATLNERIKTHGFYKCMLCSKTHPNSGEFIEHDNTKLSDPDHLPTSQVEADIPKLLADVVPKREPFLSF